MKLIFLRGPVTCWRSASAFTGDADDELWNLSQGEPILLTGERSEDSVYHRILSHRGLAWIFHAFIDC
jgi:hypothetical protein